MGGGDLLQTTKMSVPGHLSTVLVLWIYCKTTLDENIPKAVFIFPVLSLNTLNRPYAVSSAMHLRRNWTDLNGNSMQAWQISVNGRRCREYLCNGGSEKDSELPKISGMVVIEFGNCLIQCLILKGSLEKSALQ